MLVRELAAAAHGVSRTRLDGAAKSPRKSATRLDGKSARPLLGDRWLHSMKTVLSPAKE